MKFLIFILIVFSLSLFGLAFADDTILQVQHANIAEIIMKKYQLAVDGTDHTVFYRLSTITETTEGTTDDFEAKVTSIQINKERKSMIITLADVKQTDIMSLRFEKALISAEGKRLTLIVGDKEKGYESSSEENKSTMIFLIPANTTQVEVVGTKVIPEFPSGLVVLIMVLSSAVLLQKLKSI